MGKNNNIMRVSPEFKKLVQQLKDEKYPNMSQSAITEKLAAEMRTSEFTTRRKKRRAIDAVFSD